ncbi:MAG: 2-dehydro-3-deoxyphosphogluconate aldolase/4-hydroxy-2-oxoglutarate aldolase, partial [Geminicoccaceae bacterium]|nr:2-dehydro-3-deoxyphosphogluconate aldolase/4-hydroxy-2-oxoglutarate aldolase [Geminicoccaceae bacterium]
MTERQPGLQPLLGLAPVVPVLAIDSLAAALSLARALVEGGLPVLEITLRTPAALEVIRALADE